MNDKNRLSRVRKLFPEKTTSYLDSLMKSSEGVKKQFTFSLEELMDNGKTRPWVGKIETGIKGFERMYFDRAILMPTLSCAAYCRYCVRKDYFNKSKQNMNRNDIDNALDYIKNHSELREILITGGDPLTNSQKLEYTISGLRKIEHVSTIRIGTRIISVKPSRITDGLVDMLSNYNSFKKRIEISPQFNHPDEITLEVKKAVKKLYYVKIRIYNQSVLLKGINDNEKVLKELFMKLRGLGIESHYLYHCAPVKGVDHFRTSVQRGIEIKRYFRAGNMSGRANPQYIVLTPVGKVEPGIDGEILGKNGDYLKIRTPYKFEDFRKIDNNFELPEGCIVDEKGFIIAEYLDGKD